MKKITTLAIVFITLVFLSSQAQTNSDDLTGAQILRTARAIYDQGRLHELPNFLETAIKKTGKAGLTEAEKVEAYQILVLTYIYLEEPQKADEKMIQLLKTDHFFVPTDSDPVEFRNLYNKFRTRPLFRIGVKVGANLTQINVTKNYYVWAPSMGKGTYTSTPGIQFGLLFEKDFKNKWVLNPEIFYTSSAFHYSNSNISSVDDVNATTSTTSDIASFDFAQTRVQLNLLAQYKIGKSKFAPYVAIGPSVGYLVSSSFGGALTVGNLITIPTIPTLNAYKSLSYSVIASGGIKYKVGGVYITGDIRYLYGLNNIVNRDNHFKHSELNQTLLNYGYTNNDFSLNQAMFNIGLIIPYFNPKKLIK
jgi:hypothetical protein